MNQLCAKNTSTASRICIKKSLFWGDSWVWFHFLLLFLGFKPLWTDIRYKDQTQLINLAIVRIKEEQDFIDNTIMKFVEVLNDSGVLNQDLYLQIKYGTSNRYEILLIQNGISLSLAKLLLDKYRKFTKFNIEDDTIELDIELIDEMAKNEENQILIFEAENNIIRQ